MKRIRTRKRSRQQGKIDAIDRPRCVNFRFDSSRIALREREKNNIRLSPRMAIAVTNFCRSGFGIRRGNSASDRTPLRSGSFVIPENSSSSLFSDNCKKSASTTIPSSCVPYLISLEKLDVSRIVTGERVRKGSKDQILWQQNFS